VTTCPKGHASVATDYCDECGTPINATPSPSPAAPAPAASTVDASGPAGPCPECGTARTDRFCEVCGHDFLAEPALGSAAGPVVADAAAPSAANGATASGSGAALSTPLAAPAAAATWRVLVSADRAYYDRMRASADPDAPEVAFPAYCPQRRFVLAGSEVLIGRLSRSRGIEPGIDLTGPPEDAAVSHMHALLVATPGGWNIVDLDSANGTYLNDAAEQLAPNQPVALSDGDQVHVGGWTTLTITT
jgi:hypothetical protein